MSVTLAFSESDSLDWLPYVRVAGIPETDNKPSRTPTWQQVTSLHYDARWLRAVYLLALCVLRIRTPAFPRPLSGL